MAEDIKNVEQKGIATHTEDNRGQPESKTFTQDEVNRIVSDRLARERAKSAEAEQSITSQFADYEKDLSHREMKLTAKERLINEGLPTSLVDILKYDDEETLDKAITEIKNLKNEVPTKAWGMRHSSRPPVNNEDIVRVAMGLDRQERG